MFNTPIFVAIVWMLMSVCTYTLLVLCSIYPAIFIDQKRSNRLKNLLSSTTLYYLAIVIFVIVSRLPSLFLPELNPDESQFIAGVDLLADDPRFWISVDLGSCGPISILPIWLVSLTGVYVDYFIARLVAVTVIIIPSIFLIYKIFTLDQPESVARVSVLPLVLFFATVKENDFLSYSSELVPVLLVSLFAYLFFSIFNDSVYKILSTEEIISNRNRLFFMGVVYGLSWLTKLQFVPIVTGILLSTVISILRQPKNSVRKKYFSALIMGLSLSILVIVFYLLYTKAWSEFLKLYILSNIEYANRIPKNIFEKTTQIFLQFFEEIIKYNRGKARFLWIPTLMLIVGLSAVLCIKKLKKTIEHQQGASCCPNSNKFNYINVIDKLRKISYKEQFILMLFTTSLISIIVPGNLFIHYFLLGVIPYFLLIGYAIQKIFSVKIRLTSIYLVLFIIIFSGNFVETSYSMLKETYSILKYDTIKGRSSRYYNIVNYPYDDEVVQYLKSKSQSNDKLVVWGWMCNYYIQTRLTQGTRYAQSSPQISLSNKNAYIKEYVDEIIRNKPRFFVDAVAENSFYYTDSTKNGFDTVPLLNMTIEEYYDFLVEIDGIRIFERKQLPESIRKYKSHKGQLPG